MSHTFRIGILLGAMILISGLSAKADQILDYTLTAQGASSPLATWDMSQTPTPSCPPLVPCAIPGVFFTENVNLSLDGGPATPDTLVFLNSGFFSGLDLNDLNFLLPEFLGPQLYTGSESAPLMSVGSFTLTDDGTSGGVAGTKYTLSVTAVPEPSSMLLLAMGLSCVGIGLYRRRRLS